MDYEGKKDAFIRGFLIGRGIDKLSELKHFKWEEHPNADREKYIYVQKLYYRGGLVATFKLEQPHGV